MASFTVGFDIGQSQDYSALCVVERVLILPEGAKRGDWVRRPHEFELRPELHVRALRRWELGTPYPSVVGDVAATMRSEPLRSSGLLVLDRTGVGRALWDMLTDEHRREPLGVNQPIPITATSGQHANGWSIPKSDLVMSTLLPLQEGRLRIAEGLALGPVLERELTSFRQRLSEAGRATFDVERHAGEGHGDLASALMLATQVPNTLSRPDVREMDRKENGNG